MKTGAAVGQEPADRRLGTERREQLYVILADVEQHSLYALFGHGLSVGHAQPEAVAI